MSIHIFYDDIDFRVSHWRKIRKFIEKVISEERRISGDLNFIITDDKSLKEINAEFLQHNYFTDVICFDNSVGEVLSGEVYISLETVKLNAVNYDVSLENEIKRVLIHGVLHLCGYDDKEAVAREEMRTREDFWLSVYDSI
ncbi:MAG: rRNA maturation RNase YbeY [Odoribacter sp.]|nr:rRNA maturation RNase YbeY [Odoribacter sp.]